MVNKFVGAFRSRIKEHVRQNWRAPFIPAFIALLIVAAVSLTIGLFSLADNIAEYAFYALVAGIILQLVCFLKYRKKDG